MQGSVEGSPAGVDSQSVSSLDLNDTKKERIQVDQRLVIVLVVKKYSEI